MKRYDLGLLEAHLTPPYVILLALFDRRERPAGFYIGLFFSAHGVFRLGRDRLHYNRLRDLGWTVDQYASPLALPAGVEA